MTIKIHLFAVLFATLLFVKYFFVKNEKPTAKVVDGWVTDIRDAPYSVVLAQTYPNYSAPENFSFNICGGTIVNAQWIITTAHCMVGTIIANYLEIGVDDRRDHKNMVRKNYIYPQGLPLVDLHVCQPNYFILTTYNHYTDKYQRVPLYDICMLRVDHDLQFGRYINRAALPWTAYDKNIMNKELILSGFGRIEPENFSSASDELRSTKLKLLTVDECKKKFTSYFENEIDACTISAEKPTSSPCYGDSGSGMIYKDPITDCYVLVGVASSAENYCYPNTSTKFAKVIGYKNFIEEVMERYSRPSRKTSKYQYPARNDS